MAFRATFLAVVGVTLAGHFAALGFEMAAAARFGTDREADALAFALVLVVTLTAEVAGWVSTIFVPLYVEARVSSAPGAAAFLRRALVALSIVTLVGALLWALGAPVAVHALAPALGIRGIAVLRAFAPLLILIPLATLFAGALQAHGRFVAPSLRQLAWYGGALVSVVALAGTFGATAVPLGMVAGMTLFAAALAVPALRVSKAARGADTGPSLAHAARLLVPLALLSVCAAVSVAVERALAARLSPGSLAALTYAYRLLHFPLALFVVNATAILLPTLAGHAVRGERDAVEALTGRALRMAVVFAAPLAALSIALAEPLTQVLLERGAFTAASTAATAVAIAWYAPSVLAMAVVQVLYRAFQASHALWPLAFTAGAGFAVNLVLMPSLTALFGFHGLPLASSLSGFALAAFMLAGLRGRVPGLAGVLVSRSTLAVVAAAAVGGVAAWIARDLAAGAALGSLIAGGVVGVAAYAGALRTLAPAEARAVMAVLVPAWSRR
jgi:putative peptidoglycan lipid II flippase